MESEEFRKGQFLPFLDICKNVQYQLSFGKKIRI
jgi:hypothetical protein